MKIMKFVAVPAIAAGLLMPTIAPAQEGAQALSYEDSMGCMAAYSLMLASQKEGSEEAASLVDVMIRWSFMAVARDGEFGDRATRETETVIGALVDELNTFGEDEAAAEDHFNDVVEQCLALQAINQEEFDAVDVEAVKAAVGEASAADAAESAVSDRK